jgi:hypothetical protein
MLRKDLRKVNVRAEAGLRPELRKGNGQVKEEPRTDLKCQGRI